MHITFSLSCRAVLKKLIVPHKIKILFALYGTWMFITVLTKDRHVSVSCARLIQSTNSHFVSWRFILILSSHIHFGLPRGLIFSDFPVKILYAPHPYTCHMLHPSYSLSFDHPNNFWLGVLIMQTRITQFPLSSLLPRPSWTQIFHQYHHFIYPSSNCTFCGRCIVMYFRIKDQQDVIFSLNLFQ
jgi:hypothetical protein